MEGQGSTHLLDPTAALEDSDNCPEHRLVQEVRVIAASPVLEEDTLLENGQAIQFEYDSQSGSGSGSDPGSRSGSGSRSGVPLGESHYIVRFTCDQIADAGCYDNFLRGLEYNNTADEPSLFDRLFTLEVGRPASLSSQLSILTHLLPSLLPPSSLPLRWRIGLEIH